MKRKEFLTTSCKAGLCACAGLSFLSGTPVFAQSETDAEKALKGKLEFSQRRFAKFIEIIDTNVDEETKMKMIQSLGNACAEESRNFYIKHEGDVNAFLADIKKNWAEETEYNEANKKIKIIGRPVGKCGCSLVDQSITPQEFCNCSRGWFAQAFSEVTGRPVEVEILESYLMGGERCNFSITIS